MKKGVVHKGYILYLICMMCVLCSMSGCSKKEISVEKQKDLDFTVLEQGDIPEKLGEEIANKKENGFKITYIDGEYMYIAVGYGKRDTGGYNVLVKDLYLTKNAIYINTSLVGPRENEMVLKATTYPYIVIKTKAIDLNVVFT